MIRSRSLTSRRDFLNGLRVLAGMGAFTTVVGLDQLSNQIQALSEEESNFTAINDVPLCTRAKNKGLIYGAATSYRILSADADFASHFAKECAIVVPEGELKWKALRPNANTFDFTRGDLLAEFARTNNMLFRGHTLIWHKVLPDWFASTVTKQNARQILQEHIATVVRHYAGRIHSWDVVNEAIYPADNRDDGLRNTPWLDFIGSDYIDIAFRTAAQADPQALLVYNDFGFDYNTRDDEAKRIAVLKLLERLKSNGTPIHALGIQAHLRGDETHFNPAKLKAFLRDVASLGLKIMITEIDVADQKLPLDADLRDQIVAKAYEDYLTVVLEEPAVIAVLSWGLSDRYTWLSSHKPRADTAPVRPLPLDAQMKRKLAWDAIVRAFDKAPMRT